MRKIDYRDEIDTDYAKALKEVKTLKELKSLMVEYGELVTDASEIVNKMDEHDFDTFIINRNKENRGIFSDSQPTSIIMMPEKLMQITLKSQQFKVPSGTMYIRMKDTGLS